MIMMMHPVMTPARLPSMSAIYGVMGRATIEPTDMMAFRSPRVAGFGLLNAGMLAGSLESNWELTIFPLGQCLETIHHRSIISICGRCQDREHDTDVHASHTRFLIPCYSRELLPPHLESFL